MDKQTAIDLLDNLLGMVEDNHESDYDTAIKMGIDALKSNASNALSALDCVDRQAVINEMKDMYTAAEEWAQGAHDDDTRARAESCMATNIELKLRVEKLPSAQPEYTEQDMREQFNAGYACGMHAAQTEHTETHSCDYQRTETHDWIPVTKALPRDDEEVIVTCLDDSGDTPYSYTTVAWHYKGMWVCDNMRCLFVIAWMPLPEPYQAERREG